jgi:hypothetical protein
MSWQFSVITSECEKSVKNAHNLLIQNIRESLFDVSIIERLKNQYGANSEELRNYIKKLVDFAGNYVTFSDIEINKRGDGIPFSSNTCVTDFSTILPESSDHSEFVNKLKEFIQENHESDVNFIETTLKNKKTTKLHL